MKINLRIDFLDGTDKEVSCLASDLVKFEAKFDISVVDLEKKTRFTHLLFLAWCAEVRTKATALDFDAWTELVSMINPSEIDPK
jgi:hypothetical protein